MKKLILSAAILFSLGAKAQDTTKIVNLALQARTIEFLVPMVNQSDEDSLFTVFLKWRTSFRNTTPTGTTLVTTDTLPTLLVVGFYDRLLSNSDGYGGVLAFKNQIAPFRTANSYFNDLCTELETGYIQRGIAIRRAGRKMLMGK